MYKDYPQLYKVCPSRNTISLRVEVEKFDNYFLVDLSTLYIEELSIYDLFDFNYFQNTKEDNPLNTTHPKNVRPYVVLQSGFDKPNPDPNIDEHNSFGELAIVRILLKDKLVPVPKHNTRE
ncbi:MAG: hypothetical protein GY797_04040 [Deltaproteobacteria bacterium]|nr:hypothetical protein [Deltaproteobacteria bacterium]